MAKKNCLCLLVIAAADTRSEIIPAKLRALLRLLLVKAWMHSEWPTMKPIAQLRARSAVNVTNVTN